MVKRVLQLRKVLTACGENRRAVAAGASVLASLTVAAVISFFFVLPSSRAAASNRANAASNSRLTSAQASAATPSTSDSAEATNPNLQFVKEALAADPDMAAINTAQAIDLAHMACQFAQLPGDNTGAEIDTWLNNEVTSHGLNFTPAEVKVIVELAAPNYCPANALALSEGVTLATPSPADPGTTSSTPLPASSTSSTPGPVTGTSAAHFKRTTARIRWPSP